MKSAKFIYLLLLWLLTGCAAYEEDGSALPVMQEGDTEFTFGFKLNQFTSSVASITTSPVLAVTGPSSTSLSPRPLESSDNWQKVTDLRLYFFKQDDSDPTKYIYCTVKQRDPVKPEYIEKDYIDASDLFAKTEIWTSSEIESHTLRTTLRLDPGKYRILAVGRDDQPSSDVKASTTSPLTITTTAPSSTNIALNWTAGTTTWETAVMSNSSGNAAVTEVFTGFYADAQGNPADITITDTKEGRRFSADITLTRAVAGVLLYVKNVPAILDGKSVDRLAIVSERYYPNLDLVNKTHYGEATTKSETSTELNDLTYKFDNTSIAVIDLDDSSKKKTCTCSEDDTHEVHYLSGSFVFPAHLYTNEEGETAEGTIAPAKCSLYLAFYNKEDIKSWGNVTGYTYKEIKKMPIRIVSSEGQGSAEDANIHPDGRNFNILANHLYCLGDYRNGGDTDEPIDLSQENPDLRIVVHGAWQADVDIDMDNDKTN